ncbi:MAG TPA: HEAT repeat domain-containing protein [Gemmataceae bacterium]|jgi:HEAT repeat protein
MRRVILIAALALCGCTRPPTEPVRAHGRTAAEWAAALRGPDVKARRKAVAELANLGAADPAVVPALAGALTDRDAGVRDAAAVALYSLGPVAKDAAPALEAAKADRDPKVRDHAAKALARVRS